jgi:DNA-binding MarR family transcriptional regulator
VKGRWPESSRAARGRGRAREIGREGREGLGMGIRTKFRLETAPEALRQRTGFVIGRLALLMRQRSAARLGELGLTMRSYAVLCCLAEFGRLSQKDIAARAGIDPSDLVPLLDELQGQLRVFCEQDDADCRRDEVRTSGVGTRLLARASRALDEVEAELLGALSSEEQAVLRALAARVVADAARR